jgi:hypothetical protein
MITMRIEESTMKALRDAFKGIESKLPRNLATAINATAKTVRVQAAKELGKVMPLKVNPALKSDKPFSKAKTLKKAIKQKAKASPDSLSAKIGLWEGHPFPLKYFDARPYYQKKKNVGITYKTDKAWKSKAVLTDAFAVKRWGNNIYRRKGKERIPLEKLHGPKPGDYFESHGIIEMAKRIVREELPKNIQRRVRAVLLAQQGIIKLKKGMV